MPARASIKNGARCVYGCVSGHSIRARPRVQAAVWQPDAGALSPELENFRHVSGPPPSKNLHE